MASVSLVNVSKVFSGNVEAVSDLTLEIADGQRLVIVGPSGCGKTTTLRLIAGLDHPSRGEICFGGQSVANTPPARRNVAMMFQNPALYPHLDVRGNIAYSASLQRRLRKEEVERAARRVGLAELLGRMPHELSGGQQRRAMLARVLLRQPAVYLLDEPLAHLDGLAREDLRNEIKRQLDPLQATVIYVTHDLVEALTMGDRVAVMNEGKLQQAGPASEILQCPQNEFVERFLGTLPQEFDTTRIV
jgi:multiple sugar transport system ATP-binding protein